jgi:hypothetical protein
MGRFFVVNRILQPSQLFIESGEALDYGSGLGQQCLKLGFSVGRRGHDGSSFHGLIT